MDAEEKDSSSDETSEMSVPLDVCHSRDESSGPEHEAFKDEEAAFSSDLEGLEELFEESDDGGDLVLGADNGKKRSFAETARMFKLRRNLDQLDCFHRQKERDAQKAREKLKLCHQTIESLLEQRDNVEKEIDQQKSKDSSVALFRLRVQHKQLCQQLQHEEELEGEIHNELRQQELELNEVEVELGMVSSLRQVLLEEEQKFQDLKAQKAATRLQQERKVGQNLQRKTKLLRDKQEAMLEKEKTECQRKFEESRRSQKTAAKYLKQTIKRMHQQAAEKEQQSRELIEKRMQAVKSLKSNIAANQESLRVQQNRARADAQMKEEQERQLRESLQTQGINSFQHMYRLKQLEETKRKQEEFEESQKSKRVAIVEKILQEEQLMSRKKKQMSPLKPPTTNKFSSLRKIERLLHYLHPSSPSVAEETATTHFRNFRDVRSASSFSSDAEDLEETSETFQEDVADRSLADSLVEPEFTGLWDQDYKKLFTEKVTPLQTEVQEDEPDTISKKLHVTSKKVHEKKLKGPPFVSKPDVVFFKDFDVGKLYKKKIVLTNNCYIVNHCKFLRVSAQLKDFISVKFDPPGRLSFGMSCDVQAVFQPVNNEDLEGDLQFSSTMGPFSVPIRCTTKKCCPEVDSQFVDFGSHVVGQTISRTINLSNKGALATLFSLDTSTQLSPETSNVQMSSQAAANSCLESSSENTKSICQKNSASIDAEKVQLNQQNPEFSRESQQPGTSPEAGLETCLSSDVDTQRNQTPSDSSDIRLGQVRSGEIGPFQCIKLDVIFTPTFPGETKLDFFIKFSDKNIKPIPVLVRGVAVSIPVWVVQPNVDLKICMFDRLYQDSIVVQSRASTALKLTFDVRPEMRKHMEILPKTGFIQAQSSFNAHLKFTPRRSLSKDAENYFDKDTGVLEVPMTVQVAGQIQPACFTVQAILTSSDLQFDQTEVDFGFCSIQQSVRSSVLLTNLSLLPQDFGFLAVPEFIEIQPNDGFGTLLPQETLKIDLIFSPKKAKEYHFQLSCKSGINREFLLSCRAVGVHPPLELSHSLVRFRATAVGDKSTATLHLTNRHTDNKLRQTITPEAEDTVSVGGPRLFCFTPPEDSDISISPSAGRLLPGERCPVHVIFRPRLSDREIKEEALGRLQRALLLRETERNRSTEPEERAVESSKGKKASANSKNSKVSENPKTSKLTKPPDPVDIQPGSAQYEEAKASLLYSFTQRYREFTVPCFVSDRVHPETNGHVAPDWSSTNTLYLKLQCPAVQPPLVVLSNNGRNVVDFHHVLAGERVIKKLTVQNISKESLDLMSSVLDLDGPFCLLNALRRIHPGEKHTLVFAFSPTLEKKCCEILELRSLKMVLEIRLRGEGVLPAVTSSHTGGLLDFGYVLEEETASHCVQLQNNSVVAVGFRVLLASLSQSRHQDRTDRVALLLDGYRNSQVRPVVGTQNYSGLSVFSVTPVEGSIAPGQSLDVTITFQPDHSSVNYSDRLTIELINKIKVCVLDLKGAASSHNMYLHGGDLLSVPVESLLPSLISSQPHLTESQVAERPNIPVLVTLQASCTAGVITPAARELHVGCIRSPNTNKKGGEFYWDNVAPLQQQGFSVEPLKGSVEAGHKRTLTITWTPQSGYKPSEVVQMCVSLTVKGDETQIYRVTLMALVSSSTE
ncbi:cilia- and flagella-associated protein 74 [Austrofundulus limnaeus]|uniref:Cilia- and flagella-associated protein 74 n=1 Tax=Austrofundulus limnaeus TaxID=52670 RepID=A0A2I4BDM0_AUSLI|nr:PREDICTED: cilia- and flagella-associated protein 74 [Austrofundulus limnaeus]